MRRHRLSLVILGLSLSSSWGNGHATTYRGLLRALAARGHRILFLEREQPWYANNRDLARPDFCRLEFYDDLKALKRFRGEIADADAVIVGSYVPDGIAVGNFVQDRARGVKLFYDIDTPVTLARLAVGTCEYLSPALIRGYDVYLSFSAGPALAALTRQYGAPRAVPFFCSVDPDLYRPVRRISEYDLCYLGTYSEDRQPGLERLLFAAARRLPEQKFIVAGSQYPDSIKWPRNVWYVEHIPPSEHAAFYRSSRFTLNLTRGDMMRLGFSPSVRLFEAAACGTPIISDVWEGLETLFVPEREIALARTTSDIVAILTGWPERKRLSVARRARRRVLAEHTAFHRAIELERLLAATAVTPSSRPGAADAATIG
jgi:spore maturation protein CgeB